MQLAMWYYSYRLLVSQTVAAEVSAGQQESSNYETRNQSGLGKSCLKDEAPRTAGAVAAGQAALIHEKKAHAGGWHDCPWHQGATRVGRSKAL